MITVSLIKADVGSFPGHTQAPKKLVDKCKEFLEEVKGQLIVDYYVTRCGDDLQLLMTHHKGVDNEEIHALAWSVFERVANIAIEDKLYGAGQDLLADAFSGNIRGLGPGCAEMEFEEREAESIVTFMCDKTDPAAFNLPLFKIFADPFNTPGLVIDKKLTQGFVFEVHDLLGGKKISLKTPEEMYELLALIGNRDRYAIKRVYRKDGLLAAVVSTEKLSLIAGEYVGKDDPVALVRCQGGLPAVGEVLEPFAFPQLVAGWMRGSHWGPLMPVSEKDANPSRFDGPPRIIALGFQLRNGKLLGPIDLFADVAFDRARALANEIADYIRMHGPFQPHRLSEEQMEYTTLPHVLEKLSSRFAPIE